ncbi:MAG: hypothetical protein AAGH41_01705 [Pseudomonadota bacterium]
MLSATFSALAILAAETADDSAYAALASSYIRAFGSCEKDALDGLLAEDHKNFVIASDGRMARTALVLERQCTPGYKISVTDSETISLDGTGDFGSALLSLKADLRAPGEPLQTVALRVSLIMEDRGNGPRIVRSHIAAAP